MGSILIQQERVKALNSRDVKGRQFCRRGMVFWKTRQTMERKINLWEERCMSENGLKRKLMLMSM